MQYFERTTAGDLQQRVRSGNTPDEPIINLMPGNSAYSSNTHYPPGIIPFSIGVV
jgi:hypothetical protein